MRPALLRQGRCGQHTQARKKPLSPCALCSQTGSGFFQDFAFVLVALALFPRLPCPRRGAKLSVSNVFSPSSHKILNAAPL